MKAGWRIGSVFGIPLLLDPSWFYILALVTFLYGTDWQTAGWGTGLAWIAGFAMALLLFASVLLHELGHSLVARSQGIHVTSITLFIFGGIASIDQESKTPGQAFQVAIAGPAVSLSLFVTLTLLGIAVSGAWGGISPSSTGMDSPVMAVITHLAEINLVLAIFNMIPGLPLDGGQVLKAAVWKVTGSRLQGVRWAARIGQTLGWAALILGATAFLTSLSPNFIWIAFLGWFCLRNASAYSRITDLQEALTRINASAAMTREFRVVDANMLLRQFADDYLLSSDPQPPVYFAASEGRYRGLVVPEEMRSIERSLWDTQTLYSITQPLPDIPSVTESTPLTEVIEQLEAQELRRITVLSPAGAVSGMIDRGDIVRALADTMNIPIPSSVIKTIKEEGQYPTWLQLPAIARSAND
jgi:Zn-dependent protease/CBS domain-containing protein